jgi:hypothetical protein
MEERRLHGVRRVVAIAQLVEAEAKDAAMVALVEALCHARLERERLLDLLRPTY